MGLLWTQGLCNEGSSDRPLSPKFRPPAPTLPGESATLALSALSACPLVTEKMYTSAHYCAHWRRILRIPRFVPECLGCLCKVYHCRSYLLFLSMWARAPPETLPVSDALFLRSAPHTTCQGDLPLPPPPPWAPSTIATLPSSRTLLPPGVPKPLSPEQFLLSFLSLAVYSSLRGTKALAQVHRAGSFPRGGLLPRLPSPPNLRVAPAMSAWTGLFGKMWWSFGSSLGKSCFRKNKSLWFGAVSHRQPWPCLSGEAEAEAAMYGPCSVPPTSLCKSELFARTAWVIKLSTFLRRWIVFPCYYFAFVLCSTWFHFKNPNKNLTDGARVGWGVRKEGKRERREWSLGYGMEERAGTPQICKTQSRTAKGRREKHGECVMIKLSLIHPSSVHDKALDVQVFLHIRPQFWIGPLLMSHVDCP